MKLIILNCYNFDSEKYRLTWKPCQNDDCTTAQVRVSNSLTDAAALFNLILEQVIRKLLIETKGTLLYKSGQIMAYQALTLAKGIYVNLDKKGNKASLRINENKTKIMTQTGCILYFCKISKLP